ncbi:hypothetical protein V2G26_017812 [Clonostachys chloroleuca]
MADPICGRRALCLRNCLGICHSSRYLHGASESAIISNCFDLKTEPIHTLIWHQDQLLAKFNPQDKDRPRRQTIPSPSLPAGTATQTMRRSKRLAWFFTTPQCSSAVPPSKALADFQSSASEETATYFCPSPVPFNCQIIECIIRRWHAYRGNKHKDRYRKGSPSPPETITIGCHYNYPVSPTSSPRSSPLPDYKDASSQVAAKHDHDRASDTGKLAKEVQGEPVRTLPVTTTPGDETNPRIPTLLIAIKERSKALSKILVEDQGSDESEKYCEHIKEATDYYISTMENILEHARRAERSQWKDLEG